jgi:hypothetical protein
MDVVAFKDAISCFQKQWKLERSGILDNPTLDKLYLLTLRSAASEGRLLGTRTLRTAVHDLSNRTLVHAADIETADIEEFIHHVRGERLKYMWQGKGARPSLDAAGAITPEKSYQDLKETSRRQKMLRGMKSGAKEVGKMVLRGPDSVKRVQSHNVRRERERSNDDVPEEEGLTPVITTESYRTAMSKNSTP